jgi:hypothetical protein
MALTKSQIIAAVRRLTRINSTVPYTDDQITQFVNEAIQEISIMAPFDVYYEQINTASSNVYTTSENMIDVFAVYYYPLAGDRLSSPVAPDATDIPLQNASVFPASGYAVIGDMLNWEIIRYTGKSGNTLTGVTRGVYGTLQSWTANTPVHIWTGGEWWSRLEVIPANSMFDIGVPDDSTRPTKAFRQGNLIMLNRTPVKGYGNLLVAGFTVPPPLVNDADTIRGLENREIVVIYLASIKVLASLGSEEANLRVQSYMPLFQLELSNIQQQMDRKLRGITAQTNINMGR